MDENWDINKFPPNLCISIKSSAAFTFLNFISLKGALLSYYIGISRVKLEYRNLRSSACQLVCSSSLNLLLFEIQMTENSIMSNECTWILFLRSKSTYLLIRKLFVWFSFNFQTHIRLFLHFSCFFLVYILFSISEKVKFYRNFAVIENIRSLSCSKKSESISLIARS